MTKYMQQSFHKREIVLDDGLFEGCTFKECVLVYSGGPVALIRPIIENCRWRFDKAAERTLEFLKGLDAVGQSAAVEDSLKGVKPSSDIKVF